MKLNLGAGLSPLVGYDNSWDLKEGKQACPLDLPDNSADEIRASHLLEHFGWHHTENVLREWVRVLKPLGLLKVAVPDLEKISAQYLSGAPGQYRGWIFGGQTDQADVHLAGFDFDSLSAAMRRCGLVGIHQWAGDGDAVDCSHLPISLNLAGYKRPAEWPKTIAVMSRPRLGFGDTFDCILHSIGEIGIGWHSASGAFWGKGLTRAIDAALEAGCEYVLTLDYDTLFTKENVEDLLAYMAMNPEADVLVSMQMGRVLNKERNIKILMNPKMEAYQKGGITQEDLAQTYMPIQTGHFGLTLFRASSLKKLPKPWFFPTFKEDGSWQLDDDINFWLKVEQAGMKVFLTPRVVVGHAELMVLWPDRNLRPKYQTMNDYNAGGRPRNAWR